MQEKLPLKRFTVYAIRLSREVLKSRKFISANPEYAEGMDCFYIGMTAKAPLERFQQHKAGYKSNSFAKRYGIELMPASFTIIKPRSFEEACKLERKIATRLRKRGFGIWQN